MSTDAARILEVLGEFRQEFSEMKSDIREMKQDIRILKEDVSGLKQEVSSLKKDVAVLKEDVAVLKEDVAVLKKDVADLQNRMIIVEGRTDQLQDSMNAMQLELAQTKREVLSLRTTIENVTNRNIRIISEGHLDLENKLDRGSKAGSEIEVMKVRVNMIEDEVRTLKDKNGSEALA